MIARVRNREKGRETERTEGGLRGERDTGKEHVRQRERKGD